MTDLLRVPAEHQHGDKPRGCTSSAILTVLAITAQSHHAFPPLIIGFLPPLPHEHVNGPEVVRRW
jgi:hypothetical protein